MKSGLDSSMCEWVEGLITFFLLLFLFSLLESSSALFGCVSRGREMFNFIIIEREEWKCTHRNIVIIVVARSFSSNTPRSLHADISIYTRRSARWFVICYLKIYLSYVSTCSLSIEKCLHPPLRWSSHLKTSHRRRPTALSSFSFFIWQCNLH